MVTVHTATTEPVRRLEVFTEAGRRRKWSDEEDPDCCGDRCEWRLTDSEMMVRTVPT